MNAKKKCLGLQMTWVRERTVSDDVFDINIAPTLSFSQQQSSMWESLKQANTPFLVHPELPEAIKSETLCAKLSQTTGLNTWRPVP